MHSVDACFVPSDAVHNIATRRGLTSGQLRQHGLPVRPAFWEAAPPRSQLVRELGLEGNRKTVVSRAEGIQPAQAVTLPHAAPRRACMARVRVRARTFFPHT